MATEQSQLPGKGLICVKLRKIEELCSLLPTPRNRVRQFLWTFEYCQKPGTVIKEWSTNELTGEGNSRSRVKLIAETLLQQSLTKSGNLTKQDALNLIGKECYLIVGHSEKAYAHILDYREKTDVQRKLFDELV